MAVGARHGCCLAPILAPLPGTVKWRAGSGFGGGSVGGTGVASAVVSNSDTLQFAADVGLVSAGGAGYCLGTHLRFLDSKLAEIVLDFAAYVCDAASDVAEAAFAEPAVGVLAARTLDLADSVATESASRTAVASLGCFPVWSERALELAFAQGLADSTAKR